MKVEVKETQEFEPIVLTITIESKEELLSLYTRINEQGSLEKIENRYKKSDDKIAQLYEIYNALNPYCDKLLTRAY